MINRKCKICNITKNLIEFNKAAKEKEGHRFTCKACCKIDSARRFKLKRLDYYLLYYIPSHHYIGITNEPESRFNYHKRTGKEIEDIKILYTCESRKEIKYMEAMFQSVLAMEGLSMT
jgi:hypothetical protein